MDALKRVNHRTSKIGTIEDAKSEFKFQGSRHALCIHFSYLVPPGPPQDPYLKQV